MKKTNVSTLDKEMAKPDEASPGTSGTQTASAVMDVESAPAKEADRARERSGSERSASDQRELPPPGNENESQRPESD